MTVENQYFHVELHRVAREITPKGESPHAMRTEWLTTVLVIFSLTIDKTAKNPRECTDPALAHTLTKGWPRREW